MTRDLCTFTYLLNLEPCKECSRTLGWNPASAIGEQQSKRTQSGSSSRNGRDREQQLKRTQAASMQQQLKAGAIGEQQLEADAKGEQQLKRMQSGQGAAADSKRTQAASSS